MTLWPAHAELDDVLIVGVTGSSSPTTCGSDVDVHPLAYVATTVYEPALETVIDCVVAPLLQRYFDAGLAVRVYVPELQISTGPPSN
jgi:hypothetical protein